MRSLEVLRQLALTDLAFLPRVVASLAPKRFARYRRNRVPKVACIPSEAKPIEPPLPKKITFLEYWEKKCIGII